MSEEGRALMTEREREIIAGEADVDMNYKYKVQSLVRNRVRKRLQDDVDVLETNLPKVYDMIETAVCGEIPDDVRDLREQRDEYKRDLEEARGEINELVEEVEHLQDRLEVAPDRGEIEAAIGDLEGACEQGDRTGVDVALDRIREAAGLNGGPDE